MLVKIIFTGQYDEEIKYGQHDEGINKMHLTIHCLPHCQKILLKSTRECKKNRKNIYNNWKTEKKPSLFFRLTNFYSIFDWNGVTEGSQIKPTGEHLPLL